MIAEAHLQSVCCDLLADVVRSTGSGKLRVAGSSMLPAILPGDVLTVQRRRSDELRPGEIVVIIRDGKLTAHRIINISEEDLITRGDSLPTVDLPVQFPEIVGRVESIRRNGRQVSLKFSGWKRTIAAILRRSEWCTGIYLRLGSRVRRFGISEAAAEL